MEGEWKEEWVGENENMKEVKADRGKAGKQVRHREEVSHPPLSASSCEVMGMGGCRGR